jgi:glycogen debranching enzyme
VLKKARQQSKSAFRFINQSGRILFLDTGSNNPEIEAAWHWLKKRFPAAQRIAQSEIPRHGKNNVLWWHGIEKIEIRNSKAEPFKSLRRFLKHDGRLFLSMAAVQAVKPLGLEKESPDIAEAGLYDPQNRPAHEWLAPHVGEIRGLMGFLAHLPANEPSATLLARFGGGIYLWNPKAGAPYWRFGYGPKRWPRGKVWGVHRYYIGFDAGQKLAWEYENPKVLCVGAYFYFADDENLYRQHLEVFAEACLLHSMSNQPAASRYWEPVAARVKKNTQLAKFPVWKEWPAIKWHEVTPYLMPERESDHFFDLSGERILLMGSERGKVSEIWSHPMRLCRDLSLTIKTAAGEILWENGAGAEVTIRPQQIERRHQRKNIAITERIWAGDQSPLASIEWEFEGQALLHLQLSFEVDFRLMWPYPAGALSELAYQISRRRGHASDSQIHFSDDRGLFCAHFAFAFDRDVAASSRKKDFSASESRGFITKVENISTREEPRARVSFHWQLHVKGTHTARFVALGGEADDPHLQELLAAFPKKLPELYAQQALRKYQVLEQFAEIDTPDPLFNVAARWAKLKTDAFVGHVPSLGRSLFAGFANTGEGWNAGRPGYAWFFGRDACWVAFAMLHYGDFVSVKEALHFFGRHQDVSGKILHELTTSGAAHYDAADATPLYVILMWRYLAHSGDLAFVKQEWLHVEKAMTFLFTTDRDGDGLIENAGAGHGWIEDGKLFGACAEHYLAGCWAEALVSAARLATALGKNEFAERWAAAHQHVRAKLENEFWNEKSDYFYHGKNADGSFDPNITALSVVPLLFGYGKPEQGIRALRQLAGKPFNADWGVRLLRDDHPLYNPEGYHYGSVWPLFTGWAALAEFRYGRWLQGMMHIKNTMRNYQHGALGCTEEVLHGEIYQPAGVCPHQAWSESMILQSIYEGLLGIKPHAHEHRFEMAPYIPLHWPFLSAGPLAIGDQQILFYMHREANLVTFQFKARPTHGKSRRINAPLRIDFKPIFPGTTQLEQIRRGDQLLQIQPEERQNLIRWPMSFDLGEAVETITLHLKKFFTIVPPFTDVAPGARSRGWVIIDQLINGENIAIELEGEPGTKGKLEFVNWGYRLREIKGGDLIEINGECGAIAFEFPQRAASSSDRYARHRIEITLE